MIEAAIGKWFYGAIVAVLLAFSPHIFEALVFFAFGYAVASGVLKVSHRRSPPDLPRIRAVR